MDSRKMGRVLRNVLPASSTLRCFFVLWALTSQALFSEASIGIDYGEDSTVAPAATSVVNLLHSLGLSQARVYHTYQATLQAFENSNIQLVIGITNADVGPQLGSAAAAQAWVAANVVPYVNANAQITAITVGNEVLTSGDQSLINQLLPAMQNLYAALQQVSLTGSIKVTTAHAYNLLSVSYPPSSGAFDFSTYPSLSALLDYLVQIDSFFFSNIYPYFTYVGNTGSINLNYALLIPGSGTVTDPNNGNVYTNLLYQQLDALYAALDSSNHGSLPVKVSESGWPSSGNSPITSVTNAQTYNQNFVNLAVGTPGTPLRPGVQLEGYVFALYNENEKPAGVEQNFGVYNPNLTPVYTINF